MAAVVTVCTHPRKEAVCQKHSGCTQHAAGFVGQLSTAYWLDNLKQYIATKSLRRRKKDKGSIKCDWLWISDAITT